MPAAIWRPVVVLGLLIWALTAQALETVVVTGSRLKDASDADRQRPVQVLTQDDIRATGASTLTELLSRVAAVTDLSRDVGAEASGAPGGSSVSMRHLGNQSTLVLLNGRRLSPYALARFGEIFTNVDALPLAAVERVEILKAGASSVYGSDAVAGVINVITKTPSDRLELLAESGRSLTTRRLGEDRVALTFGRGAEPGGSTELLVSAELSRRAAVPWRDALAKVNPEVTAYSPSFGTPSTFSWPGNVIGAGPVPGCAVVENGLCLYDRYGRFEAVPQAQRAQLFADLRHRLDSDRRLFGEVALAQTETRYTNPLPAYGAGGSDSWVDPRDQSRRTQLYPGLPANHPLNPTGQDGAELRYRFIDAESYNLARSLQYRVLLGLAGEQGASDWEFALGATGGQTRQQSRGAFSASGFAETIGGITGGVPAADFLNRSYRIGGANLPDVLNQLFPIYGYSGRVRQLFADAQWRSILPTDLLGPVQLSAGAELRRESFDLEPSANLQAGDIVGLGVTKVDASRLVSSAYLEALAEPVRNLTATTSLRLDAFPNLQPRFSPALSLRWRASDVLTLRAGTESGFRAPNLVESANGTIFNLASNVADPQRCLPAIQLYRDLLALADRLGAASPLAPVVRAQASAALANECNAQVSRVTQNNPNLKPETSRNLTAGFVVRPTSRWAFSADLWALQQVGQIQAQSVQTLLAREALLPPGALQRDPLTPADRTFPGPLAGLYGAGVGPLRTVNVQFDNIDRIDLLGADYGVKGRIPTAVGDLLLNLDAVQLLRSRLWDTNLGAWSENVMGSGNFRRWRAQTSIGLQTRSFTHTLLGTSLSGETLPALGASGGVAGGSNGCAANGLPPELCRTAGWTRWDYTLQWRPDKQWQVDLSMYNVFGKREPVNVARWLASDGIFPPTLEDAKGRMLQLTLRWQH